MDPRLVIAEHILTGYHLLKGARNLFRKLKQTWEVLQALHHVLFIKPLLLISEIERALPLVAAASLMLITIFLPIMSGARANRHA